MIWLKVSQVLLASSCLVSSQVHSQTAFEAPTFHHPIRRVAVVGAGPAGLQAAAKLVEHNFTVRLFERAPHPGGNWLYSEETPVRESYPDRPVSQGAEIPAELPAMRFYSDGDDGLTLEDRWAEHWHPRPLWYTLHTNSPKVSTELPDVPYARDTPWVLDAHTIQRHVRSFASHHCLNSNDYCPATLGAPPVTAYSTRVERVEKDEETQSWVLTLRRLQRLRESQRIQAEWWTETFDAVVLATGLYTTPHVPDIDGIVDWSKAKKGGQYSVYHSQRYRHAEGYVGKTVLIVGASVSASEIARDLSPFAHRIIASVRPPTDASGERQRSFARFPNTTEFVPEIASFAPLDEHNKGIHHGKIHLINDSVLEGVDEIILATGFLDTPLYPPNSTERRHLHWTGHYIHDPTLAYTMGRPWTMGRYQSYGFAKVWQGKAQLPLPEETKIEDGRRNGTFWRDMWLGEAICRRYVNWLNDASLKDGGHFVEPPSIETLELLKYYTVVHLLNNTVQLDGLGAFGLSMLADKLRTEISDPWTGLVDEGLDW
ncbi:FAD/NAD-P-binding domain-containing protein [Mycena belliarum]|uniref:FAD/NAD-P-binding domain-containing protein n=1 Tax=Mycena belliarum TaxID=1033014 RepID=A0AAD6TU20_9AGAR|nr:FAD/NAD-P-binding domain-containing protein [Mycena belliae]